MYIRLATVSYLCTYHDVLVYFYVYVINTVKLKVVNTKYVVRLKISMQNLSILHDNLDGYKKWINVKWTVVYTIFIYLSDTSLKNTLKLYCIVYSVGRQHDFANSFFSYFRETAAAMVWRDEQRCDENKCNTQHGFIVDNRTTNWDRQRI